MADRQLTRVSLAQRINVHPSLITLLERGHIPKRAVAERIGTEFGARELAQLLCGYLPPEIDVREAMKLIPKPVAIEFTVTALPITA